jgi:succinate dehydrogenase / fumarate reductase cytochrome b subunit
MAVSILHRITGVGLTVVGLAVLAWWLAAIAGGAESYARFTELAISPVGLVVLVGLTWAFYQHLLSGLRHLVMDSGAGFELSTNKTMAILTVIGAIILTVLTWAAFTGVFE